MLFEYPTSIFLDTNVFIGANYCFSEGALSHLIRLASEEKIAIYISNIVKREVEKNIAEDFDNIELQLRRAKNNIKENRLFVQASNSMFVNYLSNYPTQMSKDKTIMDFNKFLSDSKTIVLDNNNVDVDNIFNDYFDVNPPFEAKEGKKNEFPDAFIASKLKATFSEINPIFIISSDKGFCKAFENTNGFFTYEKLAEFLNIFNMQDGVYPMVVEYMSREEVRAKICSIIEDKLMSNELFINGLDYDRKGVYGGNEYDESVIVKIFSLIIKFSSLEDVDADIVSIIVECTAEIETESTYFDEANSVWDSEEKEYIYSSYGRVREVHVPTFDCTGELSVKRDNQEFEFDILEFMVDLSLDQDTRVEQVFVDEEFDRDLIEAEMMEALEEYHKH